MVPGAWMWETGTADLCLESAMKGEYCTLAFCIANDQPCAINGYGLFNRRLADCPKQSVASRTTSSLACL